MTHVNLALKKKKEFLSRKDFFFFNVYFWPVLLWSLNVAPADKANEMTIEQNDSRLTQFESHGHDGHTDDDEERGQHEVLGVIGNYVPKTNGGECDEAEVVGVETLELCFPQWKNSAHQENVGKHDKYDDYERNIQHFHTVSQAREVPYGTPLWPGQAVQLWTGQCSEQRTFSQ